MLFLSRMKKIRAFILCALFLAGCSNDLDIAADYKEITVIYGLLNDADSVHYVQVFRGFLDENTNALTIAQNPDSIFYSANSELKISRNGQVIVPVRVDAASIGMPRDSGIFVDSPNYVYTFQEHLFEDEQYQLTFKNSETGHTVTAQTPIVKDFNITRPLTYRPTLDNRLNPLSNKIDISWSEAPNGKIYELTIRFFYEEWNVSSPAVIDTQYIDWPIFRNLTDLDYVLDGTQFYPFLKTALRTDLNVRRKALEFPFEFRFYVGAQELYEYMRINEAQTGITSLQIKPEYTNVDGGLGIFSSRYFKSVTEFKLSDASLDSLTCGSITKDLNFTNWPNCN